MKPTTQPLILFTAAGPGWSCDRARATRGGGARRLPGQTVAVFLAVAAAAIAQTGGTGSAPPPATAASQPGEGPAATQPTVTEDITQSEISVERIQEQIRYAEALQGVEEKERERLVSRLRRALEAAQVAATFDQRSGELAKARLEAPQVLDTLKAALAAATSQPASQPADRPTSQSVAAAAAKPLAELERDLANAEAVLDERKQALAKLEAEAALRADRKKAIPQQLAAANRTLEKHTRSLAVEVAGESAELAAARRLMIEARRKAAEAEIKCCEEELRSYDARSESLTARTDLARLELVAAERAATALRQQVGEARRAEAERQAEQARLEFENAQPSVRRLAEENKRLADLRTQVVADAERLSSESQRTRQDLEEVKKNFDTIQNMIKAAGLKRAGPVLWRQRGKLPDEHVLVRRIRMRGEQIAAAALRKLEFEEQRSAVLQTDAEQLLTDPGGEMTEAQKSRLLEKVRELRVRHLDLLQKLDTDTEKYRSDLITLNAADGNLLAKVRELAAFIDENVLWIPSTSAIHRAAWPDDIATIPQRAAAVLRALGRDFTQNSEVYFLAFLFAAGVMFVRPRMRRRTEALAEKVGKIHTDSFEATLEVLAFSIIVSLLWPVLMWFLAHRLTTFVEPSAFSESIAAGLRRAAVPLLLMGLVRRIHRPQGLAESHFRWRTESVRLVRFHLSWLLPVIVPLAFISAGSEWMGDDRWRDSVGRLAVIGGSLSIAVFTQRLLRPKGGVMEGFLAKNKDGWLARLVFIWYPLTIGVPLGCAIAASFGYFYTAMQFERRVEKSFWLIMGGVILHALCIRWLLLAQRRVAMNQLKKKRAAAEAQAQVAAEAASEGKSSPDSAPMMVEEPAIDLAKINVKTRRLLRSLVGGGLIAGLALIWADVTPAFGFLNRVELWTHTVETTQAGGDDAPPIVTRQIEPITLADLALAILVGIVVLMLGRSLPSVLEISLLQRLPLSAAARYAISSVSQYAVTIIGLIVAFGLIGVGWSEVQWLAAAITVGLGFGLQEIFANFVSGLILLFEQPIRVGDVVTIDGTSGVVSRIRIRATTIVNWDRQELIIPNKQFVTGSVVNWTLSDNITRLVFRVGVAYGSDTRRVQRVLLDVAREHGQVLREPEPSAVFTGFGDSALNFELRAFVRELGDRVPVQHELNTLIDEAFRREGIEIPFPQRDIHVRSSVAPLGDGADGKPSRIG